MAKAFFPCDKCGECCRHIRGIPQLAEYDDGTGVCVKLRGNLCTIYATRPDICNVEVQYAQNFAERYTPKEFIELNLRACQTIKAMREG